MERSEREGDRQREREREREQQGVEVESLSWKRKTRKRKKRKKESLSQTNRGRKYIKLPRKGVKVLKLKKSTLDWGFFVLDYISSRERKHN